MLKAPPLTDIPNLSSPELCLRLKKDDNNNNNNLQRPAPTVQTLTTFGFKPFDFSNTGHSSDSNSCVVPKQQSLDNMLQSMSIGGSLLTESFKTTEPGSGQTSPLLECAETLDDLLNEDEPPFNKSHPSSTSPDLICEELLDDMMEETLPAISTPVGKRKFGENKPILIPGSLNPHRSSLASSSHSMDTVPMRDIREAFYEYIFEQTQLKLGSLYKPASKHVGDECLHPKTQWWQCLPDVSHPVAFETMLPNASEPHEENAVECEQQAMPTDQTLETEARSKVANKKRLALQHARRVNRQSKQTRDQEEQAQMNMDVQKSAQKQSDELMGPKSVDTPLYLRFLLTGMFNLLRDQLVFPSCFFGSMSSLKDQNGDRLPKPNDEELMVWWRNKGFSFWMQKHAQNSFSRSPYLR